MFWPKIMFFSVDFLPLVMVEQNVSRPNSDDVFTDRKETFIWGGAGSFILSILVCPAESFNQLLGIIIIIIFCLSIKAQKTKKIIKVKSKKTCGWRELQYYVDQYNNVKGTDIQTIWKMLSKQYYLYNTKKLKDTKNFKLYL